MALSLERLNSKPDRREEKAGSTAILSIGLLRNLSKPEELSSENYGKWNAKIGSTSANVEFGPTSGSVILRDPNISSHIRIIKRPDGTQYHVTTLIKNPRIIDNPNSRISSKSDFMIINVYHEEAKPNPNIENIRDIEVNRGNQDSLVSTKDGAIDFLTSVAEVLEALRSSGPKSLPQN